MSVDVELLWWRGCPSWERALQILRSEMKAAGLDPGTIEVTEIRADAEAERRDFPGIAHDSGRRSRHPAGGADRAPRADLPRLPPSRRENLAAAGSGGCARCASGKRRSEGVEGVKEDEGMAIGERAPSFELPDTHGELHRFGEPSPDVRATVVYWTCNHCPYALAWQERLHQVGRDYSGEGVRFLAINSNDGIRFPADSAAAMRERVDREGGWPYPYLYDESSGSRSLLRRGADT